MSYLMVGIRDLIARRSEYRRLVAQGTTIIVTIRGRPVMRLLPPGPTLPERLAELQEAGMVARNGKELEATAPAAVNDSDRQVADLLVEMRE